MNQALTRKTYNTEYSPQISQALSVIPDEDRQIIQMALHPSLVELDRQNSRIEATEELIKSISYRITIAGQEIESENVPTIYANEVYSWLLRKYPHVTIPEIKEAIKCGVYGEYGKYYGINPKAIVFFVEQYLQSGKRMKAKIAFENAKKVKEEPRIIADDEWRKMILADYKMFREGNPELIFFNEKKYSLLVEDGCIKIKSSESWKNWLLRAKEERLNTRTWKARIKGDRSLLNDISKIYSEFDETGELPANEITHIEVYAKRMIYLHFFSKMVEQNVDNFF